MRFTSERAGSPETRRIAVLAMAALAVLAALVVGPATLAEGEPVISLDPLVSNQSIGTQFDVAITLSGASDVGTVDLRLDFDPAIVNVVDADAGTSGFQITPGDIFPDDTPLFNAADNENGRVNYSIQSSASPAFSGDGTVATVRFVAVANGTTALTFDYLVLFDSAYGEIAALGDEGSVTVYGTASPTPTATSTATVTPTATVEYTLTPTETAEATATATLTATATTSATLAATATATATETPTDTPEATIEAPTATATTEATVEAPTPEGTVTSMSLPLVLKAHYFVEPTEVPTEGYTATPTETLEPTETLAPTETQTPTVTPTTDSSECTELITNGDSEDYEADSAWYFVPTAYTAGYDTETALDTRALRTGIVSGYPVYSFSAAQQTFDVPDDAQHLSLSFEYYSVATGGQYDGDRQYAIIVDQYGRYHYLLNLTWPDTDHQEWIKAEFTDEDTDWLLDLRGQRVTLHFETANNHWGGVAAMYVDNVTFMACP